MTRRALFVLFFFVLAPALPALAQLMPGQPPHGSPFYDEPTKGKGRTLKNIFKRPQKAPAAEEELFKKALALYEGQPTFLAKKYPERAERDKNRKGRRGLYYRTDYAQSIEMFQKLIYEYPFSKHVPDADFYIAEGHYRMKDYDIAIQAYQDFLVRHPRDSRVEYVYYQIAMCHWNNRKKNPLRDQTETEAALAAFKALLAMFPESKHKSEAQTHINDCGKLLIEREIKIADFYFKKGEFWSASLRYHRAWSEYPEAAHAEYASYREALCFAKMDRPADAVKLYQEALTTYPEGKLAQTAQDYVNKHKKAEKKVEKEEP